jgi:DNA-binding CsgD family transcriptional regulator
MATTSQATEYFTSLYDDVWRQYSTDMFSKYYAKDVVGRSGDHEICYDQVHDLLEINPTRFSHLLPEIHKVIPVSNDGLMAWFTTLHHDHNNDVALIVNTMGYYKIKNDKIIGVDFKWDQPLDLVMPNAYSNICHSINCMLPDCLKGLSQRELQCVFYLVQGYSAKQIASKLNISPRTVETHVGNIKDKLGLLSTRAIIDFAFFHGLVSLSPLLSSLVENGVQNES